MFFSVSVLKRISVHSFPAESERVANDVFVPMALAVAVATRALRFGWLAIRGVGLAVVLVLVASVASAERETAEVVGDLPVGAEAAAEAAAAVIHVVAKFLRERSVTAIQISCDTKRPLLPMPAIWNSKQRPAAAVAAGVFAGKMEVTKQAAMVVVLTR